MDECVEIALASDRNYFRGMAVTACSIAKHADERSKIRFHLLHIGFTEDDKVWLTEKIKAFHRLSEIVYYDVSDVDMSDFPVYASSKMTYARLVLPRLLPGIRYVLYSDVDILWLDDICGLWALRESVGLFGCVREPSAATVAIEYKWFSAEDLPFDADRYFCAGISLYNLNEVRRRDAFSAVLEFGRTHKGYNCADQSMLYGALGDEVFLLPDKWQVFPRNGVPGKKGDPMVLHYAGEAPWKFSRLSRMLTDVQLLWFEMAAEVFGETKWRSLRRFYSAWEIVVYRMIFLLIFRLPPVHALFRAWLKKSGRGPFEEAL